MPTVRTSIQPHIDLEVGVAEYVDLKRQGLLIEDPAPAAVPAAAPAKTSTAAKSKES